MQTNIGMGLGVLAFSVAMGALFAVVFAVAYGRVGNVSARLLSLYVAGGMLVSLYVVPALKYPPNPPAVSLDETITPAHAAVPADGRAVGRAVRRRGVSGPAARREAGRLERDAGRRRAPTSWRSAIVMLVLPTIDETPGPLRDDAGNIVYEGFPADDLYEFRLFSLGTQVVIWATIGLVFGALASRLLDESRASGDASLRE